MQVLFAVIDDLYRFAVTSLRQLFVRTVTHETAPALPQGAIELPGVVAVPEESPVEPETPTFRSAAEVIADHPSIQTSQTEMRPIKNTVMYVGSTGAPLYRNPTVEFDGIIERLPYGTMVVVMEAKGRWSEIAHNGTKGWMLREDLIDRAADVYPHFTIGEENGHDDTNTIRIRAMEGDMFAAAEAGLPLLSSEYVLYRLARKGLEIHWPKTRPRVEGTWHMILKGAPGIYMSITPKAGSVMEYSTEEGVGHLAFVEAVFPDETINVSETNFPDRGIYNERVLTRAEWRELKPVFIQAA